MSEDKLHKDKDINYVGKICHVSLRYCQIKQLT